MIMEAIEALRQDDYKGLTIVETPLLKGHNTAIKCGDKLYVWPEFEKPAELKVLTVPTLEENFIEHDRLIFGKAFFVQDENGDKQRIDPLTVRFKDGIFSMESRMTRR